MLETSEGMNLGPASVFVHIEVKPMAKSAWQSRKSGVSSVKQMLGKNRVFL